MRVAIITAGAAGMYCGSCLNDNTLARALQSQGHQALLVPTYTPITTDNPDASMKRVFMGGVRIYLEEKYGWFRALPRWATGWLDSRAVLQMAGKFAGSTDYSSLGGLTLSLLAGERGPHKAEILELADFLARDFQPEVIHLSNALISGIIPTLQQKVACPIVVELQGDDLFLDGLLAPDRSKAIEAIRKNCSAVARFHTTSSDYADFMAGYLGLDRSRFQPILPGIDLTDFPKPGSPAPQSETPRLGYFARMCPEKGLDVLIDAWLILRARPQTKNLPLLVGGWLGGNHLSFWKQQLAKVEKAGQAAGLTHRPCPTLREKLEFYSQCDLFSVPARMREPKGLSLLEAWAHGIPVVQPRYGSFPELIEATGGGLLVARENPVELANALESLLNDAPRRRQMGHSAQAKVHAHFGADRMARQTAASYQEILSN